MLLSAASSLSKVHSVMTMAAVMRIGMVSAPAHARALSGAAPVKRDVRASFAKKDLVEKLAQSHGMSKAESERIVNDVLGTITEKVAAGEKVSFIGFGTFEARLRPQRSGRNPKTGEPLTIPERTVPVFSAGKRQAVGAGTALLLPRSSCSCPRAARSHPCRAPACRRQQV